MPEKTKNHRNIDQNVFVVGAIVVSSEVMLNLVNNICAENNPKLQ